MMNPIVALLLQQSPTIVAVIKGLWIHEHPDEPVPTSEEVLAGFREWGKTTTAKDDTWLAAHPKTASDE